MGERGGIALQEDGRTETGILKDPGLRLDIIDGGLVRDFGDVLTIGADLGSEGRSEDVDLLVEFEIEDSVVGDVEGGGILGERMGVGADVEHHQGAEAAALRGPAGAEGVASPGGGRTGDGATEGDEGDAAVGKVGERGAVDDFVGGVVLAIEDDDLVLVVLRRKQVARTIRLGHLGADGLELGDQVLDGGMVVGNDGHLDRSGDEHGADEDQGQTQVGADAGKHGLIK